MLTIDALRAEVARVSYKPGYRFVISPADHGRLKLAVIAEVADADHSGRTEVLRKPAVIPPMVHGTAFHHWLKWHLGGIELDEVDRFYRVDGQPFNE